MKRFSFLLLFIFYSTICMAKVIVAGLTVPLDIAEIENQTVLSEQQAKALAMALTNKLHESGYTTSYVARYEYVGNDCFLYVTESRINDIRIQADETLKEAIMNDLKKLKGAVYNKYRIQELMQQLRKNYLLDSVRVNVINDNNTDDVLLVVNISVKTLMYSFEVSNLPVYGVVPRLMLSKPMHNAVITAYGNIGFHEEMITQKKGKLEYMRYPGYFGWHAGFEASQEYAEWERYATGFTLTAIQPFLGAGIFTKLNEYDISLFIYGNAMHCTLSSITKTVDTLDLPQSLTNAGFELRLRATDRNRTIAKKNKYCTASIYPWFSNNEHGFTSRISLYFPLRLSHRLHAIPVGYSFYTTSSNRVFWEYVFDSYLLGYEARYTATQSRHIAGFECMYELIYEMLFCSVFTNSGLYKDEYGQWTDTANAGLSADLYYHSVIATAGCAWNIHEKFERYYIFTGLRSSW
ncbi:MAG: hypothetical protein WBK20_15980 [Spirochaetota bacterium]